MRRFIRSQPLRLALLPIALVVVGAVPGVARGQSADAVALTAPAGVPAPVTAHEYRARRQALAATMDDGVLLALGPTSSGASFAPFAQSPDVLYLTGLVEEGVALLLEKRGNDLLETLFVLPGDPGSEIWDGKRLGVEAAQRLTGIRTRPREELASALDSLLSRAETLYTTSSAGSTDAMLADLPYPLQVLARLRQRHPQVRVLSLAQPIPRLRAAKSPAELDRIRRAVHITALAHREAMRAAAPGMNEFELHALIEYTFRRNGADHPGFGSIVGSGPNSTTLHYRTNDRFFDPGDLVVMDIGAGYDGYTADVTRTIPVDGSFSPEQRAIYEVVLSAQKAAVARVRPGATWDDLNQAADAVLAQGLARLGLIESPDATYQGPSGPVLQLRLFYMHGLGHGIGLQVHDPEASYFGPFQPGSAFTIEPGLYIRPDALDYLADTPQNRALRERLGEALRRYAGIGVRIEDDYIVTADSYDRISAGAPREIDEIEALMRSDPGGRGVRHGDVVEWYRSLEGN